MMAKKSHILVMKPSKLQRRLKRVNNIITVKRFKKKIQENTSKKLNFIFANYFDTSHNNNKLFKSYVNCYFYHKLL